MDQVFRQKEASKMNGQVRKSRTWLILRGVAIALSVVAVLHLSILDGQAASPVSAAAQADTNEWWGEYYDNVNLIGSPRVRNDPRIDFDWGEGSPMAGIPADNFSARWTRRLHFEAQTYRFNVRVDDGVRLWVDGQLLVDQWHDGALRTFSVERAMTQGQHDVRVEMYEHGGQAAITFWLETVGSYANWKGEYFANRRLAGEPALVRDDARVDFGWGAGAPAPGLPADKFSVRWTRQLYFAAGAYRFSVEADDGARLWVDDRLVIDQWHDGIGSYSADVNLAAGQHRVRMEMYEHTGDAKARLWWTVQTSRAQWRARYYANRHLKGRPVLVRTDTSVDFDWGTGAPAAGLPADGFSVKWVSHVDFGAGTYRFCATADDGVSVEMDDRRPFLREWHDGSGTYCRDVYVPAGRHKITVEYFEHQGVAAIQVWWQKLADG
jgi:hypothetical protein